MRILVIGGYGLIGSSIVKALIKAGHNVIGLGRSPQKGIALLPKASWKFADLQTLISSEKWTDYLVNVDIVINASGLLQSAPNENITVVQQDAIIALIKACENANIQKFIQISAPNAESDSHTQFYRTKAAADSFLKTSRLDWTIFRPGLVISPQAFGGTSLLRMLGAIPILQVLVLSNAKIQTISVNDVAIAAVYAVENDCKRGDFDLMSPQILSLKETVLHFRQWLGFPKPLATITLPKTLGNICALIADGASLLGWKSALRSTALKVLDEDIQGNSQSWTLHSGLVPKDLQETLSDIPSTLQERIYARAILCFPIALITLSLFWVVSGVIGFVQYEKAIAVFSEAISNQLKQAFVLTGSVFDILIGGAILIRPLTRFACWASIAISTSYLIGAAIFAPYIWADPLGPMIKVFPAIALAIIVAALIQDR